MSSHMNPDAEYIAYSILRIKDPLARFIALTMLWEGVKGGQ
jgi:hypothetical protein